MKIIKYIWHTIINIIKLLIIIWIFSYVDYWFETLVMSILILIYINIEFYIISNWYAEFKKLIWFTEEFIRLRILLKDSFLVNNYDNENDIYNDILELPKQTFDWIMPKFYVTLVSSSIVYIICIINIIKTIW